ncbi:MAG: glycosyltransferase family 39 protein [Vampirovibrionales bacterium]|nr:glycosyltransferase family 39 protein [Vampirovibrionales bacterium]
MSQSTVSSMPVWQKIPTWGWLLLLCAVVFGTNLWGYSLFDVDEPRYAQCAREMMQRGDWITPYFNGEVRFDKPPLFYWLLALSYSIFGVSEWSARLVSAGAATAMVLGLYTTVKSLGYKTQALWAAGILSTSLLMVALAHMSITDMTLSLWMTLTTLALYRVIGDVGNVTKENPEGNPKQWLWAGLWAGVGILTKGPVALMLPGGILVVVSLLLGRFKKAFATPYFAVAIFMALALSLPWYWAAYQANGQAFLEATFNHNVSRFSGAVDYHPQPWWYFFPVVLVGFMPWIVPALVWGGAYKWHLWKHLPQRDTEPALRLAWFSGLWTGLVFWFFTIAKTKLLTYILPLAPGYALWMACLLTHYSAQPSPKLSKTLACVLALIALALIVAGPWVAAHPGAILPKEARHLGDLKALWAVIGLLVLGFGASAVFVWHQRIKRMGLALVCMMVWVTVTALVGVVPAINAHTQGDLRRFAENVSSQPSGAAWVSYEITKPSLTYYANQPVLRVLRGEGATFKALAQANGTVFVVTKNRLIEDLKVQLPKPLTATVVDKGVLFSLVKVQ